MGVESQNRSERHCYGDPCRHDSLLFGSHSLSPALLAAEVAPAQAVSVPSPARYVKKFMASWGSLQV